LKKLDAQIYKIMQAIPLLQIIFCLAMLFMPSGAMKFTVSSGDRQSVTWVHQADGAWQAKNSDGKDMGLWSLNGLVVSVTQQGQVAKTDVSEFVKVVPGGGQEKQVSVDNQPVTVTSTTASTSTLPAPTTTTTFSQDKESLFAKPVAVTYSSK
jgi:hypothetical protein